MTASGAAAAAAALLWLASQPWYQRLPWLDRATDVPAFLVAVMAALLALSCAARGLDWLGLRVPRLRRTRRAG